MIGVFIVAIATSQPDYLRVDKVTTSFEYTDIESSPAGTWQISVNSVGTQIGGSDNDTRIFLFTKGSSTKPVDPCNCGNQQPAWKTMKLTVGHPFSQEYLDQINTSVDATSDKFQIVFAGYGWNNDNLQNRDPISLAIPPGDFIPVGLNGAHLNPMSLNRGTTLNGQKCGVIFQDPFQGIPSQTGGSADGGQPVVQPLPTAVPISKYCQPQSTPGYKVDDDPTASMSVSKVAFHATIVRHLTAIDAVCRCHLGVVGAMMELSGVYLTDNPVATLITDGPSKVTMLTTNYNWTESTLNDHPRAFACREDYTVYWLVAWTIAAYNNQTTPAVSPVPSVNTGGIMAQFEAHTWSKLEFARMGQWYNTDSDPNLTPVYRSGIVIRQDMLHPSQLHSLVQAFCVDHACADWQSIMTIATNLTAWTTVEAMSTLCSEANTAAGFDMCNNTETTPEFYQNMVIESLAYFMRYAVYASTATELEQWLETFDIPFPENHVIGDNCTEFDLGQERRIMAVEPVSTPLNLRRIDGFTFYRGGLPNSRLVGMSNHVNGATAGWPEMCHTCYYNNECGQLPCCSGQINQNGCCVEDGDCLGYPLAYRHGAELCTFCGNGSTYTGHGAYPTTPVSTCDAITFATEILSTGTTTVPTCFPTQPQPVRASLWTDTRAFDYFGTVPVLWSGVTSFYTVGLFEALDPRGQFLFGKPVFDLFSGMFEHNTDNIAEYVSDPNTEFNTLDLTYRRWSGDLTLGEIEHLKHPMDIDAQSGCLGGGCYDSLTEADAETLEQFIGNASLFRDTAWSNDPTGITLLGAMLRLYTAGVLAPLDARDWTNNGLRGNFLTTMLYGVDWGSNTNTLVGDTIVDNSDLHTVETTVSGCVALCAATPGCTAISHNPDQSCRTYNQSGPVVTTVSAGWSTYVFRSVIPKVAPFVSTSRGTSFASLVTAGTAGPIPANAMQDRTHNVFAMLVRLFGPLTSTGEWSDLSGAMGGGAAPPGFEPTDRLGLYPGGIPTTCRGGIPLGSLPDERYCYNECHLRRISFNVPPWLWDSWCGLNTTVSTLWRAEVVGYETALEQSLSVFRDSTELVMSYGTTFTQSDHLYWFNPNPTTEQIVGTLGGYCWQSSRGIVGDLDETQFGLCLTLTGTCYWIHTQTQAMGHVRTTQRQLGCTPFITDLSEYRRVYISTDSVVHWETNYDSNIVSDTACYAGNTTRYCTFAPNTAGRYPPMFDSPSFVVQPATTTAVSIDNRASLMSTVLWWCGCDNSADSEWTVYNFSRVCRIDGSAQCVLCPPTYAVGQFRCGSVIYNAGTVAGQRALCRECRVGSIGQCIDSRMHCTGYDPTTGQCPETYSFCTTGTINGLPMRTLDTAATTLKSALAPVPLNRFVTDVGDFVFQQTHSGTSNRIVPWAITSMTMNQPYSPDTVHCTTVQYTENGAALTTSLEHPRYLAASGTTTTPGLTIPELGTWCGHATSAVECWSADRRRMCYWDLDTCVVRVIQQQDYDQYGPGKATFNTKSHDVVYPTCYTWVNGIDPVSECQARGVFTGCVLTQTTVGRNAVLSTNNTYFNGNNQATTVFLSQQALQWSVAQQTTATVDPPSRWLLYNTSKLYFRSTTALTTVSFVLAWWNQSAVIEVASYNVSATHVDTDLYSVNVSIVVIGLPWEDTNHIFADMHENKGIDLGLRGSVRGLPESVIHVGWEATSTATSVPIPLDTQTTLLRTCVPITTKVMISQATIEDHIQSDTVYRRSPVDCAMLATNSDTTANPIVALLFREGGVCDSGTGSQLGWLSSVALDSNARHFSRWFGVMREYNTENDGYVFFTTLGADNVAGPVMIDGGTPPTCGATANTDTCYTAIDQTAFVPCYLLTTVPVPSCQKPQMQNYFPRYTSDEMAVTTGYFAYSTMLYKTLGSTLGDVDAAKEMLEQTTTWWLSAPWNQYMAEINYCDFNYPTAAQPEGLPMFCLNDPMSYTERVEFCTNVRPHYTTAGVSVTRLDLTDLCPWMVQGGAKYCFVIAGHPAYGSVGRFMAQSHDWNNVVFYYMPVSMRVITTLLFATSVANTLVTNHASEYILLDDSNYDTFNADVARMYTGISGTSIFTQNVPIRLAEMQEIYAAVQKLAQPDGSYLFPRLADSPDSTIVLDASAVFPGFVESGTQVPYDNVRITSAITGVYPDVKSPSQCNRYTLQGEGIEIDHLTLDQSACATDMPPIVFSGTRGSGNKIHDIIVPNSKRAVLVAGGATEFSHSTVMHVDGLQVYRIAMALDTQQPVVFSSVTGNVIVGQCSSIVTNHTQFANCAVVAQIDQLPCIQANQCITTTTIACCSRAAPVANNSCALGYRCPESQVVPIPPNGNIACSNPQGCNCQTGSECVVLVGSKCTNSSNCKLECAERPTVWYSRQHTPVNIVQGWQYSSRGSWYPSDPYYNPQYGTVVDFYDAVGYGDWVWGIEISGNTIVGSTVIWHSAQPRLSTVTNVFSGISIVPSAGKLKLTAARFQASVYNSIIHTNGALLNEIAVPDKWCVSRDGARLAVTECETASKWVVDATTGLVHLDQLPLLCPSKRPGDSFIWLLPCNPCSQGTQKVDVQILPSANYTVFNMTAVGATECSGSLYQVTPMGDGSYAGYVIGSTGMCLQSGCTEVACTVQSLVARNPNVNAVTADRGILQEQSAHLQGGILSGVTASTDCINSTIMGTSVVNGTTHGYGATIVGAVVTRGGYGYTSGQYVTIVHADATECNGSAIVQTIVSEAGNAFTLEAIGINHINITAYTHSTVDQVVVPNINNNYSLDATVTYWSGVVLIICIVGITVASIIIRHRAKQKLQ